jgi:hypothetical protein
MAVFRRYRIFLWLAKMAQTEHKSKSLPLCNSSLRKKDEIDTMAFSWASVV